MWFLGLPLFRVADENSVSMVESIFEHSFVHCLLSQSRYTPGIDSNSDRWRLVAIIVIDFPLFPLVSIF
jgi:hypothetical protein